MSFPMKVPLERIKKLRAEHPQRPLLGQVQDKQRDQDLWFTAFCRTLSPSMACNEVNIPIRRYQRWRKTDHTFCERYNAVLDLALEELQASVFVRALGSPLIDEEGNCVYDGAGRLRYVGGSDRLAMALLGMSGPKQEEKKEEVPSVEIVIVSRDSEPSNGPVVIEGEVLGSDA